MNVRVQKTNNNRRINNFSWYIDFLMIGFFALLLKNYLEEQGLKPIDETKMISLYRQLQKQNFSLYKQISVMSQQITQQFKQLNADMVKGYLEGP